MEMCNYHSFEFVSITTSLIELYHNQGNVTRDQIHFEHADCRSLKELHMELTLFHFQRLNVQKRVSN